MSSNKKRKCKKQQKFDLKWINEGWIQRRFTVFFLYPCLTGPCVVSRTPQLLASFSKMPTVVHRGQQSRPHTAQLIFCAALRGCCAPCWRIISDLTSVGGGTFSWRLTPGGYIKLLLCAEEWECRTAEKKEPAAEGERKKRKVRPWRWKCPRLAVRGQTVADSAETGQLTCCSHGPPVCVPITAPDFHPKQRAKKKTHHKIPTLTSLPQALILLLIRSQITSN